MRTRILITILALTVSTGCLRLSARLLEDTNWIREQVTEDTDRPQISQVRLLKSRTSYSRRVENSRFSPFQLRRRGKKLRVRFRSDGSLKGIIRSFKSWYRQFKEGLSKRKRRKVLRKFKRYLKTLKKMKRREISLMIGKTRKLNDWSRRRRGGQEAQEHHYIHHHIRLRPEDAAKPGFYRDMRRWLNKRGSMLGYSRRRRSRRLKWLKLLRRLRKRCYGNRKCILYLKNNRPRSRRSLRRIVRFLKKFTRRRRRYMRKIRERRRLLNFRKKMKKSRRKRKWSFRKTGRKQGQTLKAENGSLYYIPHFLKEAGKQADRAFRYGESKSSGSRRRMRKKYRFAKNSEKLD